MNQTPSAMRQGSQVLTRASSPLHASIAPPTTPARRKVSWLHIPALVFLIVITQIPFVFSVWFSLHSWNLLEPSQGFLFVGLSNYVNELVADPDFWPIIGHTVELVFGAMALALFAGTILALLLDRPIRGKNVLRGLVTVPFLATPSVMALIWKNLMLSPDFGIINWALRTVGLPAVPWFSSLPLESIAFIVAWEWTPFVMLVLLAGLQSIPDEVLEAAKMDGTPVWKTFWTITFPMLRRFYEVALLFGTIFIFQTFGEIYLTTGGGPGMETNTLPYYTYETAFNSWQVGRAAALGVIGVAVAILATRGILRLMADHAPEERRPPHNMQTYLGSERQQTSELETGPFVRDYLPVWSTQTRSYDIRRSQRKRANIMVAIRKWSQPFWTIVTYVLVLAMTFPVIWMMITGLKQETDAYTPSPTLIFQPTLDQFQSAINAGFGAYLFNSIVASLGSTTLAILLGIPAAYCMVFQMRKKSSNGMLFFVLSTRFMPFAAVLIPLYVIASQLNLLDNLFTLVIVYTAMNLPLIIWMARSYFLELPKDVLEGARLDGCNTLRMIVNVVVPMAAPGLVAAILLTIIFAWNEFFFSITLTYTESPTLPIMMAVFSSNPELFLAKISALATAIILVPVALGMYTQRHLVRVLTGGVLK